MPAISGKITITINLRPNRPLNPEPLDEMWTPDKIVAYRVIRAMRLSRKLGSPPSNPTFALWNYDMNIELEAKCDSYLYGQRINPDPCTETPGERCRSTYGDGCGYYAYKDVSSAHAHIKNLVSTNVRGYSTVVSVFLSGKVIEHEIGYRAEILEVTKILDVYEHGVVKMVPDTDSANYAILSSKYVPSVTSRVPHTEQMTTQLLPRTFDVSQDPNPLSSLL